MKWMPAIIAFALASTMIIVAIAKTATSAQGLQTCGQAAVIAPDQSITLYPWLTVSQIAAFTPSQANGGMPPAVHAPTKITIEATMPDAARVCLDSDDGTVCTTVGAVRAMARKAKP